LERKRPVRAEVRVRSLEEPQPQREPHSACEKRDRAKCIVRPSEQRCSDPDQWKEEGEPRDRQEDDLKLPLAAPYHRDPAAPLPVWRADCDHRDARQENDHLCDPEVHVTTLHNVSYIDNSIDMR